MHKIKEISSEQVLSLLRRVHDETRAAVIAACQSQTFEQLCGAATAAAGDTVYAIDRIAEQAFILAMNKHLGGQTSVVLIGEGVPGGKAVLPTDASEVDAPWRVIVDPIDGTRGYMFQKRPAWILSGAARNRGDSTSLADIEVAVQTELPLAKQHLGDSFWAIRGLGAKAERFNRITGEQEAFTPQPSQATTVAHGYATICSFFAGGRDLLGKVADELSRKLLEGNQPGDTRIFEDQYASTGGQIAGLTCGQDRFVADLRPLLAEALAHRGDAMPHCCHPYDLCTKLIAEELGITICSPKGEEIDVPLDTEAEVVWVGYANDTLRRAIEPVLQEVLNYVLK